MDQMIGDWAMVRRNGQSICGLTLTNTEATADNFQVFLKPRCDPAVAAFAPTMWRLGRGGVVIVFAGGGGLGFSNGGQTPWGGGGRQRRAAGPCAGGNFFFFLPFAAT